MQTSDTSSLTNTAMMDLAKLCRKNGISIYGDRYPHVRKLVQAAVAVVVSDHQFEEMVRSFLAQFDIDPTKRAIFESLIQAKGDAVGPDPRTRIIATKNQPWSKDATS